MEWQIVYETSKLPKDKKFLVILKVGSDNKKILFAEWEKDYDQYLIDGEEFSHHSTFVCKHEIAYYLEIPNQPERSKREDSNNIQDDFCKECSINHLLFLEMRCSEHCGNTVRELL